MRLKSNSIRLITLMAALVLLLGALSLTAMASDTQKKPVEVFPWGFGEQKDYPTFEYGTTPKGYGSLWQSAYLRFAVDVYDDLTIKYEGVGGGKDAKPFERDPGSQQYVFYSFRWEDILSGTPDVGTHYLSFTISENQNAYDPGTYKCDYARFTVVANEVDTQLVLSQTEGLYTGEEQKPTVIVSDGVGGILIDSSEYQIDWGTGDYKEPGTYTITIRDGGTENYNVKESSASYTISYLAAPPLDTIGTNGYFDGSVYWFRSGTSAVVTPPAGYQISTARNGTYGSSVTLSERDSKMVYFKRASDGALTDAVDLSDILKFDSTVPAGRIIMDSEHAWEQLQKTADFASFFKRGKGVSVDGTDPDSGIKSIEYYVAGEDLIEDGSLDSGEAIAKLEAAVEGNWRSYEAPFFLNKNAKNVVYAKLTDRAGNVSYVSSDGIVVYSDSAVYVDSIRISYYEHGNIAIPLSLKGNEVHQVSINEDVLTANVDFGVADDELCLYKEYLNTLDVGEYIITVSFHPQGIPYVDGPGNEPPVDVRIPLEIKQASMESVSVTPIDPVSYDGSEKKPAVTVTLKGKVLSPDTDYTVSYENNVNAGTATTIITPKADGCLKGDPVRVEFTINPLISTTVNWESSIVYSATKPVTVDLKKVLENVMIDGDEPEITNVFAPANGILHVDYDGTTLSILPNSLSGPWGEQLPVLVDVVGLNNYVGICVKVYVTVTDKIPVDIDLSGITLKDKTYDGKTLTYTGAAIVGDFPGDLVYEWRMKQLTGEFVAISEAPVDVGEYQLRVSVADTAHYAGSQVKNVKITPKTVTVTAENKEAYVGSSRPELTYKVDGLVDADMLSKTPALTTDANMDRVGTYTITVSGAEAGSNYTVSYVNGTLTVKNIPVCPGDDTCPMAPYTDLKTTEWYHEAVDYVLKNGMMQGDGSDKFRPNEALTRSMMVQVLYNLEGKPAVTGKDSFPDTKDGAWYSDAILWASQKGIVLGYDNGNFGPSDTLTREQMATILSRYAKYKGEDVNAEADLKDFTDGEETSSWAEASIRWASAKGIIKGSGDGSLRPTAVATRAQIAQILLNYLGV